MPYEAKRRAYRPLLYVVADSMTCDQALDVAKRYVVFHKPTGPFFLISGNGLT